MKSSRNVLTLSRVIRAAGRRFSTLAWPRSLIRAPRAGARPPSCEALRRTVGLAAIGPACHLRIAQRSALFAAPVGRHPVWRRASCLLTSVSCLLLAAGCRQDMHNQPKYRPLREAQLFADGASARPLVEGTVARGTLHEDEAFFTGKIGNTLVTEMPFPVDQRVLDRGQERFNIFCAPCHDRTGNGRGMVVQRGYRQPTSFHIDRLRQAPPGHFFDVMTNGLGAMPDYRGQIPPRDRWAIVAYIKALQLSQHTPAAEVPGGDPTKLTGAAAAAAGAEKH